jgi:hypothetical protein
MPLLPAALVAALLSYAMPALPPGMAQAGLLAASGLLIFTAALLGSQPMGFYAPAQLVRDARAHGVRVLPADVNKSDWHATLEGRTRADGREHKADGSAGDEAAEDGCRSRGGRQPALRLWPGPPLRSHPPAARPWWPWRASKAWRCRCGASRSTRKASCS